MWQAQLAGSIIQGGTSLAGSLISSRRQYKYARKLAQNQIQWRVADAKKAGIHPLYALGAPTISSIGQIGGIGEGIAEAGQAIGGAVSRMRGKVEKEEEALRLKLLQSQIGESDARKNLLESEAARNRQSMASQAAGAASQLGVMDETASGQIAGPSGGLVQEPIFVYESDINYARPIDQPGAGLIERTPSQVKTHKKGDEGTVAGRHPGFKEYILPNGLPIMLPEGDTLSEVLEETPFWMWKSIYSMNKNVYGDEWGDAILRYMWGEEGFKPFPFRRKK